MEFCPKCGCVLMGKGTVKCPRCNYKTKSTSKIESSEKIEKAPEIGVITDKDTDVFPSLGCMRSEATLNSSITIS